jgi:hypothetical protein
METQKNICCNEFQKLLHNFGWFSLPAEGGDKLCMPYMYNTLNEKIRVNNCPVCGANVRDIQIVPELLETK